MATIYAAVRYRLLLRTRLLLWPTVGTWNRFRTRCNRRPYLRCTKDWPRERCGNQIIYFFNVLSWSITCFFLYVTGGKVKENVTVKVAVRPKIVLDKGKNRKKSTAKAKCTLTDGSESCISSYSHTPWPAEQNRDDEIVDRIYEPAATTEPTSRSVVPTPKHSFFDNSQVHNLPCSRNKFHLQTIKLVSVV